MSNIPIEQQKRPAKSLTKKQRAMIDAYIADPKTTKKQAYLKAYKVKPDTTPDSITSQVTQAFGKPLVKSELDKWNGLLEDTVIGTVRDWGKENNTRKREIAVNSAQWAHDKIHGKAKQSVDITKQSVEVKLDLTGVRLGTHYSPNPITIVEEQEPEAVPEQG